MNTELHNFLINHKFKYDEFGKIYKYYKSEHDDNNEISKIEIFKISFVEFFDNVSHWTVSYYYNEPNNTDIEFDKQFPVNYQITIKDIKEIISFFKINFV